MQSLLVTHTLLHLIKLYITLLICLYCSVSSASEKSLQPIGIEATTHLGDQQTFRKNDVVSFLLSLERDAYITAIYVDAHNNLYQIIPNAIQQDNFYSANLFIPVPPQNATYNFKVQPPYGEETLWVFASDTNRVQLKGQKLDTGIVKLTQTLEEIRSVIKSSSRQQFDEASVHIKTSAD